jgi:iron(III) transport system substrate-binding protein
MTSVFVRGAALGLAAAGLATLGSGGMPVQAEELTVYTAVEADDLSKYAERFNRDHPDIDIQWVRDSTGIITAKLLAEKDNPQADIVWGLAATSLMLLKNEGMLEPYAPPGLERLDKRFVDSAVPPAWTGMDAWAAVICFNTVEAERLGLPMPTSWQDLTDPVYKGYIAMPNPNSSGTGFLDVSSWLQLFGEEKGWQYMDQLHENIAAYTHSGSKPCRQAAAGEVPIGVSFEFRAARLKEEGAPIEIIVPQEGIGWDMEATAIVKGTDKPDAAKTLADWSVSEAANQLYAEGYAVVAIPEMAQSIEYMPEDLQSKMIDNDFDWAASNRERILAEWQKRYDVKSEPKS